MNKQARPQIVLCDIDGVLADLTVPVVDAINREHGTTHVPSDWTTWEWPMVRLSELAQLDFVPAFDWAFSDLHVSQAVPFVEAQRVLGEWAAQGTVIHVATSRPAQQRQTTLDWLKKYYPFISPENIHIREDDSIKGTLFKRQQAEQILPEMYFEDEGVAMMALVEAWPEGLRSALRLIDQPWNRPFSQLDAYRTNWESVS